MIYSKTVYRLHTGTIGLGFDRWFWIPPSHVTVIRAILYSHLMLLWMSTKRRVGPSMYEGFTPCRYGPAD